MLELLAADPSVITIESNRERELPIHLALRHCPRTVAPRTPAVRRRDRGDRGLRRTGHCWPIQTKGGGDGFHVPPSRGGPLIPRTPGSRQGTGGTPVSPRSSMRSPLTSGGGGGSVTLSMGETFAPGSINPARPPRSPSMRAGRPASRSNRPFSRDSATDTEGRMDRVVEALLAADDHRRTTKHLDLSGRTALHAACGRQVPATVLRQLLDANAEAAQVKDGQGQCPLHAYVCGSHWAAMPCALQGVVNVLEAAVEMAFEKWRTPEQQDKHFARKHGLSELDAQDRTISNPFGSVGGERLSTEGQSSPSARAESSAVTPHTSNAVLSATAAPSPQRQRSETIAGIVGGAAGQGRASPRSASPRSPQPAVSLPKSLSKLEADEPKHDSRAHAYHRARKHAHGSHGSRHRLKAVGTVFRTARPPTPEEEALYPYQLAEKSRALLGESGLNPANDKVVQLLRALVVPHDKVLASRARFEMQPGHDVPVLVVDNLVEQARDEVREAMAMLQREAESGGLPEGLPEVVMGKLKVVEVHAAGLWEMLGKCIKLFAAREWDQVAVLCEEALRTARNVRLIKLIFDEANNQTELSAIKLMETSQVTFAKAEKQMAETSQHIRAARNRSHTVLNVRRPPTLPLLRLPAPLLVRR